ncbi:hypothetical protein CF651_14320 [Paenibacillus rigui]|uniref:Uncharacterized protein n=1 Tax=Paenibacillus rigui TaxID=554312 RepID=A0A229UQ61_9BACL|nr:hypothetical protein CF651_14320 [Paenibacillus rigui]
MVPIAFVPEFPKFQPVYSGQNSGTKANATLLQNDSVHSGRFSGIVIWLMLLTARLKKTLSPK